MDKGKYNMLTVIQRNGSRYIDFKQSRTQSKERYQGQYLKRGIHNDKGENSPRRQNDP